MKTLNLLAGLWLVAIGCGCGDRPSAAPQEAELACGQCQFGMAGTNCDLAVRLAGRPYFVTGFQIDDFGDAHGTNGLCNAIRRGQVKGRVEQDRFVADKIELR